MPPNYSVTALTRILAGLIPAATEASDSHRRESVATIVWLVGLASAALALIVTNLEKLAFLGEASQKWLVALLGLAIVSGVVHRVLLFLGSTHEAGARLRFTGFLVGYMEASGSDLPIARSESWTDRQIVDALKADFDLDYEFLLEYDVPSEKIRAIYDDRYRSWERSDREQMTTVVDEFGKLMGVDPVEARRRFGLAKSRGDAEEEDDSSPHVGLLRASGISLLVAGGSFAAAAIVVALGFLF